MTRRAMLRGATLGGLSLPVLTACGSGGGSDSGAASGSSGASGASGASGSSGGASIAASAVPVGGGAILPQEKVVVTQPTQGQFKAFSAICTHAGCPVGSVKGGQIVCPCHGSHFSITDGAPTSGPASKPLAAKKVTEKGGTLTVT